MKAPLRLAAAAMLALAPFAAAAQDATEGDYADPQYNRIMASVYAFMEGLQARDAEAMRAQVIDGGSLTVVRQDDSGNQVQAMPMDEVIDTLAAIPFDIREPLEGEYPIYNGPVAMVWAPYNFYREGELSHCGINVFTLVEQGDDWRIATVTYSHIEEGCMEPANQ